MKTNLIAVTIAVKYLAIAFRVLGLQRAVIGPDASCAE
jgi:hypothetical protein